MRSSATSGAAPRRASQPAPAASRPLRLLQVLGYAGVGGSRYGITGVERVVQQLLEGLDAARFEHYLIYPEIGELSERFRVHARRVLAAEPRRRYDARFVRLVSELIRDSGVDIVLSHGMRLDFLVAIACRSGGVPHVVSRAVALADETMPAPRKALFALLDGWTLRSCTGIVAVSEASKATMQRTQHVPYRKITVIPNGVRLPRVAPDARLAARRDMGFGPESLLVGGIGQLIPRKAFDELLRALAALRPRHPGVAAVILGEGPERARLEALARESGLPLHLPGYLPDPYPSLAALDVAVLPSRAEGMPLAVLESMALGVPTIATNVGGTPEIIGSGSGLLVQPGDINALTRGLDSLLSNPDLRRRMAEAGMRRVEEHFSLEAMLRRFDAYLWHIAGRSEP